MTSRNSHSCDVLVIGSGAAGLAAAITARKAGLEVIVAEKEHLLGGTTAYSGGFVWVPGTSLAAARNITEQPGAAMTYLRHETGELFDEARVQAFLDNGPRMIEFFHNETAVKFDPAVEFADYHPTAPGGVDGGRSLGIVPFDLRALGELGKRIRKPLRENTVAGITIGTGKELQHFFNANRSLRSALYVAWRFLKHARDVVLHGQSMWSTMGNALVARLVKTAMDFDIPIWPSARAARLVMEDGRVTGAVLVRPDGETTVTARKAVVLACGGFPHDKERQKALYPHVAGGAEHLPVPPPSNTGDGLRLAEQVGGLVESHYPNAAAWVPVSKVRKPDGSTRVFAHFVDRYKPGVIAVGRSGKRFVNEADSYHDFVQGMFKLGANGGETTAFLICDHQAIRRFGMGFVKPAPVPISQYLRSGYVLRGDTLEELAAKAGIDPAGLRATVEAFNVGARNGDDPEFGKGNNAYNRLHGDKTHKPNPCVAPVAAGPFYAIQTFPGEIGSFAGLRTDENARVLNADGLTLPGLYAVGNDMASIMGGNYPGGGITLGPAMTFGFIAGRHIAGHRA